MKAVSIVRPGERPVVGEIDRPEPGTGEVLIEVEACGVCRTDLHLADGESPTPKLPVVPGHEIVGRVVGRGIGAGRFEIGDRVGIPWLGWTCGECEQCLAGRENLCPRAVFTGQGRDGGYAELTTADERYCLPIPAGLRSEQAAPLLCAGLIGYRALRMAGEGRRIGLYGFGAAAHIIAQLAARQGRTVFAFTRPGDDATQAFALELGAGVERRLPRSPAGAARRGDHLRAGRRARTGGIAGGRARWGRRLRGHPHVGDTGDALRAALGGADRPLGREPDPSRRRGVHGADGR
jgi:propanol-preferring alcohol dehydrogenase